MMDCNTRKIVRPNDVAGVEGFLYNTELENSCENPAKIKVPSEVSCMCNRTARFSDIDFNGHVNNTVYADIMCDALPEDYQKRVPKSFEINYVNEVLQGEHLEILAFVSDDEVVISGRVLEKIAFVGKFVF
jgi:acyl-ACP thioesterase